jgi:cytochrome c
MAKPLKARIQASAILSLLIIGLSACAGGGTSPNTNSSDSIGISSSEISSTSSSTSSEATAEQIMRGMVVYDMPAAAGNVFSCSDCHALSEPATDGLIRAGHPIGDALRRPSFKNGQLTNFIDATNSCLDEWMASTETWTTQSAAYQDLVTFLTSVDEGEGDAPALSFQIVAPLNTSNLAGSSTEGEAKFNKTCAACHAEGGVGSNLAPSLVGVNNAESIARRVRTSGAIDSAVYTGLTGGRMPFWAADRMTDGELEDVIAFILSTGVESSSSAAMSSSSASSSSEPSSGCSSTHPNIGQTTELVPRTPSAASYGVSGTATIIDDCTIRLSNFSYNGRGIRVLLYGGVNGIYNLALNNTDLRRTPAYVNETLDITIENGFTLDNFNGVSIWCVGISQSFGDGIFQ